MTPEFLSNGFSVHHGQLSEDNLHSLEQALETFRQDKTAAGVRNLLSRCEAIHQLAVTGAIYQLAGVLLGAAPQPVRGILFDKTPESNWYVTWHQDLSIPVNAKSELPGYGPWSIKDDVVHVQPPAAILEQMVSLRIHLDDCDEQNGAIKFIAGSHLHGVLDRDAIEQWKEQHRETICPAVRGDIIAMRPLILHASSAAKAPRRRRVLHLEYATAELPTGLDWAMA